MFDFQFKKLDLHGVQTLVNWAEEEGWNPGPNDAEVYYQTDPDGFYGYFHNDQLIGGGSIVSYNKKFGFMGFFIVRPEYRAKGLGRKLWYQRKEQLLSRLKPGAPIGMDGVLAMQDFYAEGGFQIAFRDERYEKLGTVIPVHPGISPVAEDDMPAVHEYDRQCFGYARPQFLKQWIQLPEGKSFKYTKNGQLKGFAIVRKANTGFKVCPLFADNKQVAEELYKACLNAVAGHPLYLDIPVCNKQAVNLVNKYQAEYVFECARMYHGSPPDIDMDRVFGITSFELG